MLKKNELTENFKENVKSMSMKFPFFIKLHFKTLYTQDIYILLYIYIIIQSGNRDK